jgi:hypothetical protein
MRRFVPCVILLSFVALTWAASAPKKAPTKKSGAKTSGAKSTARKSASKSASARKAPAKTWRNRQLAPTPARYREIQEALVSKGYLAPEEVSGQWTPASAEALKNFQTSQNIAANGKINSLSLIALGLGPKRENTAVAKPPAPAQQ